MYSLVGRIKTRNAREELTLMQTRKRKKLKKVYTGGCIKTRKRNAGGGLNWGTYTNKKKKAGGGLIPGDVYKQGNKWLEGGLHLGMNTNKKKKTIGGLTLGNL